MVDGRIDGRFIIREGQGITQGIAEELGLTKDECKQISGSVWSQIIQEVDDNVTAQNNNNAAPNKSNNYLVHKDAVIQFTKECWQKIVGLVNNALGKNIQTEETEEEVAIKQERMEAHKKVVDEAVKILEDNWDLSGLSEHFASEEDKELFLQCLRTVKYDATAKGTGHASMGEVIIETDNEQVKSTADMLKLLIHEANHAFKQQKAMNGDGKLFTTKSEEQECETIALKSVATLVNKGVKGLDDFEIHGTSIKTFAETEPTQVSGFNGWLEGYNKLPDNMNGDITIHNGYLQVSGEDILELNGQCYKIENGKLEKAENDPKAQHFELTPDTILKWNDKQWKIENNELVEYEPKSIQINGGDVLIVNGGETIRIGEEYNLEGSDGTNCATTSIMKLLKHRNYKDENHSDGPETKAELIFDDMPPTEYELQDAKFNINKRKVPFVLRKADGTEYTGYYYE